MLIMRCLPTPAFKNTATGGKNMDSNIITSLFMIGTFKVVGWTRRHYGDFRSVSSARYFRRYAGW